MVPLTTDQIYLISREGPGSRPKARDIEAVLNLLQHLSRASAKGPSDCTRMGPGLGPRVDRGEEDPASVVRNRSGLSALFGWCVREQLITSNPVTASPYQRNPRNHGDAVVSEAELEAAYERWLEKNQHLADVFLIISWTGLRWAEARSLRVSDLTEVPTPGLLVRRSDPEGVGGEVHEGPSIAPTAIGEPRRTDRATDGRM